MILGISAFYHDAAAALVDDDGRIIAAAQEERFSRRKHDPDFPREAIRYCLAEAGIGMDGVDVVAFYEKSWIKFERILETQLAYAPRGFAPYLKAMPVWLKEKMWIGRIIERELDYGGRVVYPEHHESHAASAFFPSPFSRAAILTMDGVGEWATATWGAGSGSKLELHNELEFPHSLGLLYSAFTYYTGFRVNSGEYKVMGLAPYGQPTYARLILDELMDLRPDGSFRLNMEYFQYGRGLTMTSPAFHDLFGGEPRAPESPMTQRDMDLARSIQEVTEEVMLRMARHVRAETGERNLCMAGGVALNSVGNGRIVRERIFDRVWIQPAAGDAGGALGAALFACHQILGAPRTAEGGSDRQQGSYLGPAYDADAIGEWLRREKLPHRRMPRDELSGEVASRLADRAVVGWFSGRAEFGPRALGARSILADARSAGAQRTLNQKIKFRESFRPFAPACLEERASEHFELEEVSPYMLIVAPVREECRLPVPPDVTGLDRLRVPLSDIPAVTHVDYSARVQTVGPRYHPEFRRLLEAFESRTGCPVLVNTSFNRRGEPIVGTPADAYVCFMNTEMDVLVLEDCVLLKSEQPNPRGTDYGHLREHWSAPAPEEDSAGVRRELRQFGLVMTTGLGILGGLLLWRGSPASHYLLALSATFLLLGMLLPAALKWPRRAWLALGGRLAGVTNALLLAVVYVLAITPTALLMRVGGRDRLGLRSPPRESYWVSARKEGAADRYDRPY